MTVNPLRTVWDIETLDGKLLEWEDKDQHHLRNAFGYWRMVEKRMIRAQITAEGGDPDAFQAVSRRVDANHKDDPSLRERQKAQGLLVRRAGSTQLTGEELQFLADHFEGANDPLALEILRKVRLLLTLR